MTRKEAQRRLSAALREQQKLQKEVRAANARVVAATRELPPHYVDERHRFAPGQREQIQKLIDHAQRASDRLGIVIANVNNLRRFMESTTKKSAAQLDHEIKSALSEGRY